MRFSSREPLHERTLIRRSCRSHSRLAHWSRLVQNRGTLPLLVVVAALAGPASSGAAPARSAEHPAPPASIRVIVHAQPLGAPVAARLVRRLGGEVTRALPIVDGFAARVPAQTLSAL